MAHSNVLQCRELLPGLDCRGAAAIADRIEERRVSKEPLESGGTRVRIIESARRRRA